MKAVSRVHITPHMHWDREWYFTTEESRILLVNNMEEILCRLEQDNEYKYYVLDGQTAILEDYFAVKPENKDRVKINAKLPDALRLPVSTSSLQYIEFACFCRPNKAFMPYPA